MASRPAARRGVAASVAGLLALGACSSGAHPAGRPAAPAATATTTATTPTTARPIATTTSEPPGPRPPSTSTPTSARPCLGAAPPRAYRHVIWIVMENRGLDQVAGSASAPYLNGLAARCGLATDYSAISHPSLPNYLALTSGSTHGVSDDAGPASHPITGPSLFSLLGQGWRSLEESMPANCDPSSGGEYAVKHNPAAYYSDLSSTCPAQDVPLMSPPDLSARFTFVTPNLCDDMHDCSTATGDAWLAREVPAILASPQYADGSAVLFITWDENDAGGSLVPTYVVAPSVVAGTRSAAPFDHYSLLRTTEQLLGAGPLLGGAATATSMQPAFHL